MLLSYLGEELGQVLTDGSGVATITLANPGTGGTLYILAGTPSLKLHRTVLSSCVL